MGEMSLEEKVKLLAGGRLQGGEVSGFIDYVKGHLKGRENKTLDKAEVNQWIGQYLQSVRQDRT